MLEIFLNNMYLILLFPLWIFLIIMIGRFFSVYVNKKIIHILSLLSSLLGMLLTGGALWKIPADKILNSSFPFIKINDFIIDLGLYIDKISLIFVLILFSISFFVHIFSISYMKNEKKTYRFYALLNLFNFSIVGLFFSPNLFQTYLFWELAGIASYFLIGFKYNKEKISLASKKVFLINRIGDSAFISGLILSSYFIYTYAPNKNLVTLSFIDLNTISTLIYAYASNPLFDIICLTFLLAAVVKSAQFPFYTWLQDAMKAKLPVSALLHSSTLVAAGIYLTYRLLPFYTLETYLLKVITIIGIITAIICSFSACSQTNPKKVLAYSTSAQIGLIFFALGILNIKCALAIFIAHAIIKSLLFITLPKENETWDLINFVIFLISGLSLSGIIFSGMIAKEMLAINLGVKGTAVVSLLAFMTAFYIIRIALLLFNENNLEKKEAPITERISTIGLLISNIIFYIYLHFNAQYQIAETFWAGLTAWIVVYILYIKNAFWKVPILYPISYNGFYIDKFYTKICTKIYSKLASICNFIDTKILSNYNIILKSLKLSINIFKFIENSIMNGFVTLITKTFKQFSLINKKAQTSNIQKYNTYAFLIITTIIICLILGYTSILIYIGG